MKLLRAFKGTQQGLTLVELMVAMILGILVMVGIIQLLMANKESYRSLDGLARVQEAGRFASYILSRDFASTGHVGCSGSNTRVVNVARDVPDEILPNGPENTIDTMTGYDSVTGSITLPSGTVITPVAGTDIINVRGISPAAGLRYVSDLMDDKSADVTLAGGNLSIIKGETLLIANCRYGDIVKATNDVPASSAGPLKHGLVVTETDGTERVVNDSADLSEAYGADAIIGKLRSYWYYIKQESRLWDGKPVLTLHRVDLAGTDQELVEGVENMQIYYGIDDSSVAVNPTPVSITRYVTAAEITGKQWERVMSARVHLLVNSVSRAARARVPYSYDGADGQLAADVSDFRLRREFVFVNTLRNHTN